MDNLSYTINGVQTDLITTADDGTVTTAANVQIFDSEAEWEAANGEKVVADDAMVFIKQTGEMIFGKELANTISDGRASLSAQYTKRGFDEGEARPEYYYDCKDITDDDPTKHVEYTKQIQDINYTIANNTTITINTEASDVFDTAIARDVDELINVVQKSINANNKVAKVKQMMTEAQYQSPEDQAILKTYLDAAQKEADFADDNLQKTYEHYITRFDGYMESANIAITNIGSMKNRLTMTQTHVENQQTTIESLKSQNEDRDISDIIIDYYASYNAYQSSLTAAGKVGERTLLDYI
jgi:flagellar hook-associated protein 3 FlgL